MKRRRVSEDDSIQSESEISSEEEEQLSKSDENEISRMARELSNSIPRQKVQDLLHSMATSKDILYWNSHGEMTYHQRKIPVTNMIELIEYTLLPYNPDVRAPRGLKTFMNGLSELGIDKKLIHNKMLLANMVARQLDQEDIDARDNESESEPENDDTDVSSGEEENEEESDEQQDSGSESDDEDDNNEQVCYICDEPKSFHKIAVAQCPLCLWHENYHSRPNKLVKCDICSNIFPIQKGNIKQMFYRCEDCNTMHILSLKSNTLKPLVITQKPEEEEVENKRPKFEH